MTTTEPAETSEDDPTAGSADSARSPGDPVRQPATGSALAGLRRSIRSGLSGIRVRVVAMYVVLLTMAVVVATLATRQVLLARLDAEINASLAQEVEELRILAGGVDPVTGEPFGTDVARIFDTFLARNVPTRGEAFYTLLDGRPYASSPEAPADLLADPDRVAEWTSLRDDRFQRLPTSVGEARTLAVPLLEESATRGTFVVAFFPRAAQADILSATRTVAAAGLGVLLLSGLAAWWLAGRVLRPVKQLTETARRINDTALGSHPGRRSRRAGRVEPDVQRDGGSPGERHRQPAGLSRRCGP